MNKNYVKTNLTTLLISVSSILFSQNVGINTTGATPSTNAILDLNSGNSGNLGLIIPSATLGASLTTFNPPIAHVPTALDNGMMIYNSVATNQPVGYYYWNNTASTWVSVSGGGGAGWGTTGNSGTNPAINYAGTTTGQDFVVRTTAIERMRFLAAGGAGIGTPTPKSAVDVNGNMSIGTYAGVTAAPANGIIVSGEVGIGTSTPAGSAIIDMTNTKATGNTGAPLLWPTNPNPSANIIAPVLGEEIYNSTTGCFNFYNGAAWLVVGCPCTVVPAVPTITASCAQSFQGSTITYTSSITTGVTFSWTATATTGVPTITGNGTSSITVTWPASGAGTGTVTLTLTNLCGSTVATQSVTIYANPTISGTTPIAINSPANIYSCSIPGATYAWSFISNTDGSTIVGSTTAQTVSVTAGATAGSFTLQCIVSFGACSQPATYAVSVVTCAGAITLDLTSGVVTYDNFPADLATMTVNISTSQTNELILVTITGYPQYVGTPIMTNAGAAIPLVNFYGNQATDATFGFIPTAIGVHTISAPAGSFPNYEQVYAAAFIGFCSLPSIAANVSPYPVTLGTGPSAYGAAPATLTASITPPQTNSYIYGVYDNSCGGNKAMGNMTWTTLTRLAATNDPSYSWDMSVAGAQVPNTTPYSISCTDTQSDWSGNATILDLYDIHK
jgi:hypothetical protein